MEPPTVDEKSVSKGDTKTKEKKARSPAQIAAQQKALATLKEKRDKLKAEEDKAEKEAEVDASKKADLEKAKYEKAKMQRKRLPPAPSYITTNDLDKFKNDLLGSLSAPKPAPFPDQRYPAPVALLAEVPKELRYPPPEPVKAPEPVKVEPTIIKPVPVPKLTGHELLDRIFFNK